MKIRRRHFLTLTSILAIFPLKNFFNRSSKIRDDKIEFKDKKYILLNVVESPSRWMFDTILRPTESHSFIENKFIGTQFDHIGKSSLDFSYKYNLTKHNNYLFPSLWDEPIPTRNGQTILKSLADNILIVRGCNMVFDGHEINSKRLEAPENGSYSISGLHDHHSSTIFPCLALEGEKESGTAAQAYSSPSKNVIPIKQTSTHYINDLFESFLNNETDQESDQLLEEIFAVKFRRDNLGNYIKGIRNKRKAKRFIKTNYNEIKNDYESSIAKYQTLIDKSIRSTKVKGVTDKEIPGLKLPITLNKQYHKNKSPFMIEDYIGAYKQSEHIILNKDFREIFKTAEIRELSKQLALTETAIKYNLTSSIILNISPLKELQADVVSLDDLKFSEDKSTVTISLKENASIKKLKINHEADSHQTGSLSTLICDTLMWRAVASCTNELINSIKNRDEKLWKNTLIHLTTEFEREPGEIDKGSHHGFTGHTSTFFSGSIEGTNIIGNIYDNSYDPTDVSPGTGTWGKGAPIEKLAGRTMVYGNIASSIADFLGCPSPMPHEPRIFKLENGKITSLIEDPKNKKYMAKTLKFDKPAAT